MTEVLGQSSLAALAKQLEAANVALKDELSEALLDVAEIVAEDARRLMGGAPIGFGGKTIQGIRARVKSNLNARVEQQRRRSSKPQKRRPNYGTLQMRYGLTPAAEQNEHASERAAETAVARIIDRYMED